MWTHSSRLSCTLGYFRENTALRADIKSDDILLNIGRTTAKFCDFETTGFPEGNGKTSCIASQYRRDPEVKNRYVSASHTVFLMNTIFSIVTFSYHAVGYLYYHMSSISVSVPEGDIGT